MCHILELTSDLCPPPPPLGCELVVPCVCWTQFSRQKWRQQLQMSRLPPSSKSNLSPAVTTSLLITSRYSWAKWPPSSHCDGSLVTLSCPCCYATDSGLNPTRLLPPFLKNSSFTSPPPAFTSSPRSPSAPLSPHHPSILASLFLLCREESASFLVKHEEGLWTLIKIPAVFFFFTNPYLRLCNPCHSPTIPHLLLLEKKKCWHQKAKLQQLEDFERKHNG